VKTARLADDSVRSEAGPSKSNWGLALRDLSPEDRQGRSLGSAEGVLVAGVAPGSPAADADIQPGDLILRVNRTPVRSVDEVRHEIAKTAAGKPLLLLVRRADGNDRFAALAPR
jgi:serine protease Do